MCCTPAHEREFLNSSACFDFARVQVSLRIGNDGVHVVELSRIASRVACRALNGAVASEQRPDHVVFPVGDE